MVVLYTAMMSSSSSGRACLDIHDSFSPSFQYFVAFGGSSGGHTEDRTNSMQDRNDVYYGTAFHVYI